MNKFGEAIEHIKNGGKAKREVWNGKEQYIQLATRLTYLTLNGELVNATHEDIGNRSIAFNGTSGVQIGWLASRADMLSEDWILF